MLSRAGALLRACPATRGRRSIARNQWATLRARNYAEGVVSGGKKIQGTTRSKPEEDEIGQAQDEPLARNPVRRVASEEHGGQLFPEPTKDARSRTANVPSGTKDGDEIRHGRQLKKQPKTTWATEPLKGVLASGTVTTSKPSATTLDDLLSKIRRKRGAGIPAIRGNGNPTTIVLLFTPAFAHYALDQNVANAFFDHLRIQKSFGNKYQVTSAVVDRLPTKPDEIEGREGMAYMYFANPPVANPGDQSPLQASSQKPGSMTFRVPQVQRGNKKTTWMDYEIQLPLCQTVFSTGLVSTMIQREYVYQPGAGASLELCLLGEKKLESQTVQFPALVEIDSRHMIHMPLVALTPFRRINYVMGNIIRKLSTERHWDFKQVGDGRPELVESPKTGEDMPASQELEEAVSAYFEALHLQPETVSVWALVMPRYSEFAGRGTEVRSLLRSRIWHNLAADDKTLAEAWHPANPAAMETSHGLSMVIRTLIGHGARLIKVLSGGGGWGKKAGLLSLDPDVQYSTRDLRKDEGWQFNFENFDDGTEAAAEAQKAQALGQIVKEGESIMFLLAPKQENLPESTSQALKRLEEQKPRTRPDEETKKLNFSFGALPSSIDFIPGKDEPDSAEATITHYPDCFGMLSEGGMAVSAIDRKKGTSNQTKLDVPHGRFIFQHYHEYHHPNVWANLLPKKSDDGTSSDSKGLSTPGEEISKSATSRQPGQKKGKKNGQTPTGSESEQKQTNDLFEQFAEYEGSDFTSPPSSEHKSESQQNGNPL